MWSILSLSQGGGDFHEPSLTERNLVIFLLAVENIFLDNMRCGYPNVNKEPREYGHMVAE
jgi:hypothetical protein